MNNDNFIVYFPDMDWVADPKSLEDQTGETQLTQAGRLEGTHEDCKVLHGPPPPGSHVRNWTLRNDNHGHHHGVVSLSESPLYLHLSWRRTAANAPHRVGTFRLNLSQLLQGGYVRADPADSSGTDVRLRIVRADDGRFYVQANDDGPRRLLA
jgi:hypothetical protein